MSRSGKQMAGLPKVGHSFIGIEEHINRGTHKQMAGLPEVGHLIGIEAKIICPPYYWPKDKCSWTVQCMEHEEDGRAKGGHRFKVLLIQSQPPYKDKNGHKSKDGNPLKTGAGPCRRTRGRRSLVGGGHHGCKGIVLLQVQKYLYRTVLDHLY